MLSRANYMHSDAASQGGGWWQGCGAAYNSAHHAGGDGAVPPAVVILLGLGLWELYFNDSSRRRGRLDEGRWARGEVLGEAA